MLSNVILTLFQWELCISVNVSGKNGVSTTKLKKITRNGPKSDRLPPNLLSSTLCIIRNGDCSTKLKQGSCMNSAKVTSN